MSSLDSTLTRQALAEGVVVRTGTDTPVALRLRYVGSGTVTSVTVTTATNIVTVTSDGGTDTYAFATYATLGALADAINGVGIFEAKVLDDLRSSATASQYVNGAITSGTDGEGNTVWDVELDTSAALRVTACLSAHRDFDKPSRRVKLNVASYLVNMGTAAADSANIYLRRGNTETKLVSTTSVDNTATTLVSGSASGALAGYIGGGNRADDEYIVLVKDAATLADAAGNYVHVAGTLE